MMLAKYECLQFTGWKSCLFSVKTVPYTLVKYNNKQEAVKHPCGCVNDLNE